ncbi:hypothetical protein AB685_27265 [Bacillus sp. LL01]|uniref:hypothetical protein n=1 Tax=Bacillus sp. LL01 TaxID=1665556 RepID=UPI00064D6E33|nr:hypothetical protein [Bacillus sp. LL01]KMJ55429.1 hypothetical protein AB685_27265 [Bacillus sp. LL01]
MTKIILFVTFLLPWLSLLFASKETIKTYMPVTIFTSLLMTIIFQIAYTYEWWVIYQYIVPWGYMSDVSFTYGIFAIGTFWIYVFTSHKFPLYVGVNLVTDAAMAFGVLPLLGVMGIAEYKNILPGQYFLVIFALSFVIYVYHKWQKGIFTTETRREA